MKTSIRSLAFGLIVAAVFLLTNTSEGQQVSATVSFSVFHDNLQAYGRWTNHPKYGQIWIYNQAGFTPYNTGGHWVYTQYGWTWVSDYSWGWATFHYGRWAYEPSFGWFWVPGYEWAPAWVSWRTGGDYYGWAPLGPGLSISVGVNTIPAERWVFVPRRYISDPRPNRYYVSHTKNVTIIKNTTIVNNTNVTKVSNRNVTFNSGPKREEVEKDTKVKVNVMNVSNSSKPGREVVDDSKRTVNIYKPDIDEKTIDQKENNNDNQRVNNANKKPNNANANKKPPVKKEVVKPKPKPHNKSEKGENR
ncbi:hypothetical protein FRZ67_01780 [Panacibacter ginsenosidivorans]|uniref:BcpO-related WXXGXW repeat protein n=1 Tax=Panacibacter ginsenosidivorans TaxID=1813871 RepID=A0A5B8V5K3_9BACT|nr:DUF6600 domain-containing protein [Panacibacter ginsenosidivorans]QEC66093.1 hypothetical protein FRZ67_01780 [Panacibacter ginsenosidivorans]